MAKFCARCNKLFEDDRIRFCPACGSDAFIPAIPVRPAQPVQNAAPAQPTQPAQPVRPATPAQPVPPQSAPAMPQLNRIPEAKPKKKSAFKKIVLIAIPLILVAAILLNLSAVTGFVTNIFGSDKSNFARLEKQSVSDSLDSFTAAYQNYLLDDILKDRTYNLKFDVKLSDDLKDALKGNYAKNLDIGWLDDTAFDITVTTGGKKLSQDVLIGIGGQHVLTVSALYDLESSKAFLSLKEITDDVIKLNIDTTDTASTVSALTGENKALASAVLPSAAIAKEIITKYHGIFVDNIETVTKTKETVEVGDVSEELTVYKADISNKDLNKITLAIVTEVKADTQIKAIIEKAAEELKKNGTIKKDADYYKDFIAGIEERITEINADEGNGEIALTLYDYVNSSNEIVGRKTAEKGKTRGYITAEANGKFATRCDMEDGITLSAFGTKNGDRITGEYTLKENDSVLYKIALTDFDKEAFSEGIIDGKIRFSPNSKAIKNAAPSKYKSIASLLDASFEINGKGDYNSGKFVLTGFNGENVLFTANTEYSIAEAKAISEPAGKQVEIKDLNSLQKILGDLHLDKLVSNLRKTTVPKEYVDAIDEISKELEQ